MTLILDLPIELLISIFCLLADFDDVRYLAECCHQFHDIIHSRRNLLYIAKTILRNSSVYERDVQLCQIMNVNRCFASKYSGVPYRRPDEYTDPEILQTLLQKRSNRVLEPTDEQVFIIFNRWHKLRVLQNLYTDPLIESHFSKCISPPFGGRLRDLFVDSPLNLLQHMHTKTIFQKNQKYRFYKATVGCWFIMEVCWFFCRTVYHTDDEYMQQEDLLFEWTMEDYSISESFDRLEVYDFLYNFILRHVFPDTEMTLPWLLYDNDEVYLRNGELNKKRLAKFLQKAPDFLSPGDIIDLLGVHTSPSFNKAAYIASRGAFDILGPTIKSPRIHYKSVCARNINLLAWEGFWDFHNIIYEQRMVEYTFGDIDYAWRKLRHQWRQLVRRSAFHWDNDSTAEFCLNFLKQSIEDQRKRGASRQI